MLRLQRSLRVFDVAVLGRAALDRWHDVPGLTEDADATSFGGPGANIAIHLAALGLRCTLVTALGADALSAQYRDYLAAHHVDLTFARIIEGSLPTCEMWLTRRKPYRWLEDFDSLRALADIDLGPITRAAHCMLFTDFPLDRVVQENLGATSFCSPRASTHMGHDALSKVIQLSWRCVFANRKEAQVIETFAGKPLSSMSAELTNATWIVTNGAEPTTLYENGRDYVFPVAPSAILNPIGGGDAFMAGVVATLQYGGDIGSAISVGHAAASIVTGELQCQSPNLSWATISQRTAIPARAIHE